MKIIIIEGREYKLLRYNGMWVFPIISTYEYGMGSPIAMLLDVLEKDHLVYYGDITVNLPECNRSAGCQFIDINNNGIPIIDWLEENNFGKRTGKFGASGFCKYPEFDFYQGQAFYEYKQINDRHNGKENR